MASVGGFDLNNHALLSLTDDLCITGIASEYSLLSGYCCTVHSLGDLNSDHL